MEKRSVLLAGRKNSMPVLPIAQRHVGDLVPWRLFVFAFRPFIPLVLAGLSGKQKIVSLRPLRLCGEKKYG
jgi:hypothetical protein